jgi:hypothetical protein
MERSRRWIVLAVAPGLCLCWIAAARCDDQFLSALSQLATREIRKQLHDKRFHFAQAAFEGDLRAIDPDSRLTAEVRDFNLANDQLNASVAASGRFKLDGRLNQEAEVSAVFDVKLAIIAEARFVKEGDKFFVEPTIKDMAVTLSILELAPANLSGGHELLSTLAMAAFNKNKDKIIAETNKRLGKRPF